VAFSLAGDLPRLSGETNSLSGLDLDVVDVTARVVPSQTSAQVEVLTDGDFYLLGGFVTSISTFRPELTESSKSVTDVDGAPLRPGDELEYAITVVNTGSDAALEVVLLDPLPAGVSFVPGSLEIASGANAGPLSDAVDADPGEVVDGGGAETLSVRLGDGADGSVGGRLAVGQTTVVRYRVRVAAGASGTIANQAEISAIGELGGAQTVTPTDGNRTAPGAPPTEIVLDECASDADCTGAVPFCDVAADPQACVQCVEDSQCSGLLPSCGAGRTCVCVGAGSESACDGKDDDCNGQIDEGFVGLACSVGVGACQVAGTTVCDGPTATRCDATPGTPGPEVCLGGVDEDCDGLSDAADADCVDTDDDGLADPNDASEDASAPACSEDVDCGGADGGQLPGAAVGDAGAPFGEDAGVPPAVDRIDPLPTGVAFGGGSCSCRTPSSGSGVPGGGWLLGLPLLWARRRRR
jgi:uncharacterized repeat protein (TIGR01451 family)/MYXO-CTERM domain-containing protein